MKISLTALSLGALLPLGPAARGSAPAPLPEIELRPMPVSCRLTSAELKAREETLLAELSRQILEARPLADGYAVLLKPDAATVRLAAEVIVAEQQCCPFLLFRLTAAQDNRALVLELRGPSGSRELLREILRLPEAKE